MLDCCEANLKLHDEDESHETVAVVILIIKFTAKVV
jgi:hypothetical protein